MTWKPSAGFWSKENFNSLEGAEFDDTYQAITGGYVTLVPTVTDNISYTSNWVTVTGWDFRNGLETETVIERDFTQLSGAVYSGQDVYQTGFQGNIFTAGAWEARTFEPLDVSGFGWSGQGQQALELGTGSWWGLSGSDSTTFTLEIDLACTEGTVKDDFVGHGIYIDTNNYWDYLEISPDKIQSINSTGFGIPIDLSSPKRIRIGIQNQDMYLITEDGSSIAGLGILPIVPGEIPEDTARISIGGPPIEGDNYHLESVGVSGVVGYSFWNSLKVKTGELVLEVPTGEHRQFYATSSQDLYTASFEPVVSLDRYVSAIIDFNTYNGGNTVVTPQYHSNGSWQDSAISAALHNLTSPHALDLSDFPINNFGESNPIRFKITQSSSDGSALPPAVGEITLYGARTAALLDILPSWKSKAFPTNINLAVVTGEFLTSKPIKDRWNVYYYSTPNTIGDTDELVDLNSITGSFTGEVHNFGPYQYSTKNYRSLSGQAVSGSDAYDYFGSNYVENFFPNPLLNSQFGPATGQDGYVEGRTVGEIAESLFIPPANTGQVVTRYEKFPVFRPGRYAEDFNLLQLAGDPTLEIDYTQKVIIEDTISGNFTEAQGIEIDIPSGIVPSDTFISFDIKIPAGDYLDIYATGDASFDTRIDGNKFREFRNVSFPLSTSTSGNIRLGITAPTGYNIHPISYLLDNIICAGFTRSYIDLTGIDSHTHTEVRSPDTDTISVYRSDTLFSTDLYMESYPDSQATLFHKDRDSDDKGLSVYIDTEGYIIAEYDMVSRVMIEGSFLTIEDQILSGEDNVGSFSMTGEVPIPLSQWVTVSFVHQALPYSGLDSATYEDNTEIVHAASTNRSYLLLDDLVIASQDNMANWFRYDQSGSLTAPYLSYIPDGTGDLVGMSGLFGSFDNFKYSRPVISDAEINAAVGAAKGSIPYFIPDQFYKPTIGSITGGSIYTFYGPGKTNWDHGDFHNHLLFYNSVSKVEEDNPYSSGWGHTYMEDGYAIAPFHSTFHWLFNSTGQLDLDATGEIQFSGFRSNNLEVYGWVKPSSTGEFFTLVEDDTDLDGESTFLSIDSNYNLVHNYRVSSVDWFYTYSGIELTSGEWNWLHVLIHSESGSVYSKAEDISGNTYVSETGTSGTFDLRYQGASGDSVSSAFVFASDSHIGFSDWVVMPSSSDEITSISSLATGEKSGSFTTLLKNDTPIISGVSVLDFNHIKWQAPATTGSEEDSMLWVSTFNSYEQFPKFAGGYLIFDDQLFKESAHYHLEYDTSIIDKAFGGTDSPIRAGYRVPPGAVNIAKFSSPTYSVRSSINTLNLSDHNEHNLSSYRGGNYTTLSEDKSVVDSTVSGSYLGINSDNYTGLGDVTFSDAVFSKNLRVTSLSVSTEELDYPAEAFYYYLVGRGELGVYVPDTHPHNTGTITHDTSGSDLEEYFNNLEQVKNSIVLKTTDGTEISEYEYPFDIVLSPFTPSDLETAVQSGIDINIDGIGLESGQYLDTLPDGVFSVVLLTTNVTHSSTNTLWVHYSSYDFDTGDVNQSHREIVNARPVMRQTFDWEDKIAGRYQINSSKSGDLNITIYGVDGEFTGQF